MKSPSMKGRFIYESQEIEMLQIVARCRKERAIDIISAYGYISAVSEVNIKDLLTRAYSMICKLRK